MKKVLINYANSEGSDEPAHPQSPARAFAVHSQNTGNQRKLQAKSHISHPTEWLHMGALARANVSSGVSDQVRHKPACAATEAS